MTGHESTRVALLWPLARRAARRVHEEDTPSEIACVAKRLDLALARLCQFHANEGRDRLVKHIAKALATDCRSGPAWPLFIEQADAVVTALVGEHGDHE